jgi:hypothetical protein
VSDIVADIIHLADADRPGFAVAIGLGQGPDEAATAAVPDQLRATFGTCAGTLRSTVQKLMDLVPGYRLIRRTELAAAREAYLRAWPEYPGHVPFLADFSGAYYVVDLTNSRVLIVSPEEKPKAVATDVEKFWATVARCYRERAYFTDEDGFLDYDSDRVAAIGAEMNPSCDFWCS